MDRRTVLIGSLGAATISSGLIGYHIAKLVRPKAAHPDDILKLNPNVKFQYLSTEMLLKLLAHNVAIADKPQLQAQLLRANAHIFRPTSIGRKHGAPGFYSI